MRQVRLNADDEPDGRAKPGRLRSNDGHRSSVGRGLNLKQRRFVEEYLVDLNGTQAAIRAGYSKHTAQVIASENLSKPMIAAAIAKRHQALSERTEITQEAVLKELAKIGFAEIPSDDIRVSDKLNALVSIGRHLGMFPSKVEVTGRNGGPVSLLSVNVSEADLEHVRQLYRRTFAPVIDHEE
jgi:phage terminase small subunit